MTELALSNCWYWLLLGAVISYFIGCFNFAVLISKIKKHDIRSQGSGNPGTMNMTRTFGLKFGAINFFCDAFKGALPVLCAYFIFRNYYFAGTTVVISDLARYIFGISVIIGHVFPVTMKFRGGKGIASTLGLFWCSVSTETWWGILVAIGLLISTLLFIVFTQWGSMGSLFGVSLFTVFQGVIFFERYASCISNGFVITLFALLLGLNLITWIAHHKNLVMLFAGEERRTKVRKKKKA